MKRADLNRGSCPGACSSAIRLITFPRVLLAASPTARELCHRLRHAAWHV